VSLYWRYFDPAYLFVAGGGWTMYTTHRVGVFVLPVLILIVIGLGQMVRGGRTWPNILLLFGFFTAPIAACVVGEPYAIQRELVILPFAALIAASGSEYLLSACRGWQRRASWCVLALVPLQFGVFYADYVTRYNERSAFGFEGDLRRALEEIIDRERKDESGPVYLSKDIRFVDLYWTWYLRKHTREDLLGRTMYFDATSFDADSMPPASLVLTGRGQHARSPIFAADTFRRVLLIGNVDRTVCCEILEKVGAGKRVAEDRRD
jgi:hypothetical protein